MSYMEIFPDIELNDEELHAVKKHLGDPTVRKYLHKLAYDISKFLATASPSPGEPVEEFLRRTGRAQGQVEVLCTLLDKSFIN